MGEVESRHCAHVQPRIVLVARSLGDMSWPAIPLHDGAFAIETGEGRLHGRFYGPEHQAVGGTFERNEVLGAFGGRRQ